MPADSAFHDSCDMSKAGYVMRAAILHVKDSITLICVAYA